MPNLAAQWAQCEWPYMSTPHAIKGQGSKSIEVVRLTELTGFIAIPSVSSLGLIEGKGAIDLTAELTAWPSSVSWRLTES